MMIYGLGGRRVLTPMGVARQRAAAGFLPTDIAGLKLWIDFSDATTLFTDAGVTNVSNDGDKIYQANDKSGQGNNLVQATESARPLYKTGIQNSLSAADWGDGIGYAGLNIPAKTLIAAVKTDYISNMNVKSIFDGSGEIRYISIDDTASGYELAQDWYEDQWNEGSVTFIAGDPVCLVYQIVPGERLIARTNGQESINYADAGVSAGNIQAVGYYPGRHLPGYYLEAIAYDAVLSESDIQSVETYLNNKWAIY